MLAPELPPASTIGVVAMPLENAVAADPGTTDADPVVEKVAPSVLYQSSTAWAPLEVLDRFMPVIPLNDAV